jgi:thiamine-monophosphate kinase
VASGKPRWSERELILNISEIFAEANSELLVGIGDDAAVVSRPETSVVVTTDMAVEDVHFKKSWSSAQEIGRKVAAANLADIYAMGGKPKYLTVAMAATGNEELEWMLDIARGIAHEAHIAGSQVIGGDLSKGEKIVISITAIGECDVPILRSGAQVGDSIYISSLPGFSAAGFIALEKNLKSDNLNFAISEHRSPSVDYDNAEQIAIGANSLCDVSDSLMIQGEQISDASGVCLEIDGDLITKHPDFAELLQIAKELEVSVFDLILSGGEDHCFLATGKGLNGFQIGKVLPGSGIRLNHAETTQPGWSHFK